MHSLELLLVAAPALLEDLLPAAAAWGCCAALSADSWGADDELDVFLMERVNWAHRIFKNRLDRSRGMVCKCQIGVSKARLDAQSLHFAAGACAWLETSSGQS